MNLYSYSILAFRATYGLSVDEFADEAGLPADRIKLFEAEKATPDYDELVKLAGMKGWPRIKVPSEAGGGAVITKRKRGPEPKYYGRSLKKEEVKDEGFKIAFNPDERYCISCKAYRVVSVGGEYGVEGSCLKAGHNDITYFGDDLCPRWERNPAGVINHEQ